MTQLTNLMMDECTLLVYRIPKEKSQSLLIGILAIEHNY